MKQLDKYISKAFIVSSIYLLVIILGGFFILPGVFHVNDYNFPTIIELLLKVTSFVAVLVILSSAVIFPCLKFIQKPKQRLSSSVAIASTTLLIGLVLILIHALYVKLKTCPVYGSSAWYCQVEGKSYVGMLVLVFFVASLAGFITSVVNSLTKRK